MSTSAELNAAADAADKLIAGFAGLAALTPRWRQLAQLEQATNEAIARREEAEVKAAIDATEARDRLQGILDNIEAAKERLGDANRAAADAHAKARETVAKAEADAERIIDEVSAQARAVTSAAHREADSIIAKAKDEAKQYEAATFAAKAAAIEAQEDARNAQATLDRIKGEIAALKAKF